MVLVGNLDTCYVPILLDKDQIFFCSKNHTVNIIYALAMMFLKVKIDIIEDNEPRPQFTGSQINCTLQGIFREVISCPLACLSGDGQPGTIETSKHSGTGALNHGE